MTRARQFAVVFTLLYSAFASAEGDSLFLIHENSVLRADLISRFLDSHHTKRFAIVTIDVNRIREEIRTASQLQDARSGRSLTFDLFDDLSFDLRPRMVQDELGGVASWSGELESTSSTFASVSLHISSNDAVEGNFRTSIGRIRVEPTEELPFHIVWLQDFEAEQKAGKAVGRAL